MSYGNEYTHYLRSHLIEYHSSRQAPWVIEYLKPALAGNAEAATNLIFAAKNNQRGILAVDYWRMKAPRDAYRGLLQAAWEHDHREVMRATGRRTLRAMFRYARYEIPALPDPVRAWRGTSGVSVRTATKGISWTLNRDIACKFAMCNAERIGGPMVLMVDVSLASVLHYNNSRQEDEIIVFDEFDAVVDGDEQDWQQGYIRACQQMQ